MHLNIRVDEEPYISSFTKILREVAFMLFRESEDKKYIFKCPLTLKKFSIDIHPPINKWAVKLAVVVTPTFKTMTSVVQDQETHNICPFIIDRNPFLIIWNTQGANTMSF